jgi:hypothetical protein
MTQILPEQNQENQDRSVRVPTWIYYFSDEQFVQWCKQRKLEVCSAVRPFPEEERTAIFRYMVRQRLVN